jgi:hypothetical protein
MRRVIPAVQSAYLSPLTCWRISSPWASLAHAKQQAIDWIGQQAFMGYMDALWVLILVSLAAVPLALALRKVKLGGAVHMGH